jgi:hypothetical protein
MNEITLTGWDVLDEARAMLRAAVAGVPAGGWQQPTPCEAWDVTQVLQHAALDQQAWGAALAGTSGPGENPFAPSGQLAAEPPAYVDHALDASVAPWTAIGSTGAVPTPLPQGAMATGQGSPLTPELAGALLPVARSIVEPLRAYGAYAQALEAKDGALDEAVLLSYLGRRPDWTA